jgi:hypothetical protein
MSALRTFHHEDTLKVKFMDQFGPIILIELLISFGGVLLFAWWQLRDLRKEREKAQKKQEQNQALDQ